MAMVQRSWITATGVALGLSLALSGCIRMAPPAPREPEPPEDYWGRERQYEQPDSALADLTARVAEKRERNRDAIGWLVVPDTGIDDVILHETSGSHYYLDHDIDGNASLSGSFFADFRAGFGDGTRRGLSPLVALYGHSFREDPDSGLFSGLKKFRDEEFARSHPYVYFSTWEENMAFEIIAVFEAHVDLPYIHSDQSVESFGRMLDGVFASSLYDYGVAVDETDRLVVLSTCAMSVQGHDNLDPYNTDYRFVVMARLVPPGEAVRELAEFVVNPSPAPPDNYIV